MRTPRIPEYPVHEVFLNRWSPRAFTGEAISQQDLFTMLEAGRWAASSYNSQPWRFVYALRDTSEWERLFNLLVPFNQSWAKDAAALVFFSSNSTMISPRSGHEIPSPSHSFDAGASAANFALQATLMGWHVHGMIGFDADRAFDELDVSKGYKVEAVFAVGKHSRPEQPA